VVNVRLTFVVAGFSLCDGHTKPDAGLTESTLTSSLPIAGA
jgi:hypothetical protein